MIKLSIIIPIYNVEKYIFKCLSSIYNQIVDENIYEIIAVNDGTLDNSMNIVEQFAKTHNNIHIINKNNGGVSSARNMGIQYARGKYITFVDADDYVSPYLDLIVSNLKDEIDIYVLRAFNSTTKCEHNIWKCSFSPYQVYSGLDLFSRGYIRKGVCGCVFNKDFIISNNILFPLGVKYGEDTFFIALCMAYAHCIKFLDINFYNVVLREGSATNTYPLSRVIESESRLRCIRKYLEEHQDELQLQQKAIFNIRLYNEISNIVKTSLNTSGSSLKILVNQVNIKSYLPIPTYHLPSHKFEVWLLNLSFSLYYILQAIRYKILKLK